MHDTREVAAQTAVRRTLVRYTVHEAHAANNAALVSPQFETAN